jgi:L-ribulose-5-phosphate 3-epimerase
MLLGYNTNGLAHHDLVEAVEILAEIGYRSVALTLDRQSLQPAGGPYADHLPHALARLDLRSVVETGGRYLLDRWRKHEPTLMDPDPAARERRIKFYRHAIDLAQRWGSDAVSIWSGQVIDDTPPEAAWERLISSLRPVLEYAEIHGVTIGFEPEPGMFIDTMAKFDRLVEQVSSPRLRLTLDIGHLHCQGETPLAALIERYADQLVNVHLEDMRRGVHEHLPFGEGEIDFRPVLQALANSGYSGGIHVELSRHSHEGPAMARRSWDYLQNVLQNTGPAS